MADAIEGQDRRVVCGQRGPGRGAAPAAASTPLAPTRACPGRTLVGARSGRGSRGRGRAVRMAAGAGRPPPAGRRACAWCNVLKGSVRGVCMGVTGREPADSAQSRLWHKRAMAGLGAQQLALAAPGAQA